MDWYHLALFVHIVGVLVLFAAIGAEFTVLLGLRRCQTVAQVRGWAALDGPIDRLFPLATLLILAAGIYMALTAWGWTTAWIDLAFVALLVMSAQGPLVNGRRFQAIHASAQAAAQAAPDGPLPATLVRQLHDPILWISMHTSAAIVVGLVFLMTVKPGLVGSLVALVVTLALGVVWAQLSQRAGQAGQVAAATREAAGERTRQ